MSKASSEKLDSLHGKIADLLTEALESETLKEDSKNFLATINLARQFLKDNGIEGTARPGSPISGLAQKVSEYPFDPSEVPH